MQHSITCDNAAALDQMMLACSDGVRMLAGRFVGKLRQTSHEELVQVGMLAVVYAIRRLAEYGRLDTCPQAYAMRSARNAMVDYVRLGKEQVMRCVPVVSLDSAADGERAWIESVPVEDEGLERAEREYRVLYQVLGQLRPVQREAVQLYFGIGCESMSIDDIARAWGVSYASVHGHLKRGMRRLRNMSAGQLAELRQEVGI